MKEEARVLITSCTETERTRLCLGIILRGAGVDGAVSGHSCKELCVDAEKRGFMGELRYSLGPCRCGLPSPPGWNPLWSRVLEAIRSGWEWAKRYYPPEADR